MNDGFPETIQYSRDELLLGLDESGVDDELKTDTMKQFDELVEEVLEKANCDHEEVGVSCNPKALERPASALFDGQPEEGYVRSFRASCKDCGKELSARMNIEVQR